MLYPQINVDFHKLVRFYRSKLTRKIYVNLCNLWLLTDSC